MTLRRAPPTFSIFPPDVGAGARQCSTRALREYIGLVAYWLAGKTDALFPGALRRYSLRGRPRRIDAAEIVGIGRLALAIDDEPARAREPDRGGAHVGEPVAPGERRPRRALAAKAWAASVGQIDLSVPASAQSSRMVSSRLRRRSCAAVCRDFFGCFCSWSWRGDGRCGAARQGLSGALADGRAARAPTRGVVGVRHELPRPHDDEHERGRHHRSVHGPRNQPR